MWEEAKQSSLVDQWRRDRAIQVANNQHDDTESNDELLRNHQVSVFNELLGESIMVRVLESESEEKLWTWLGSIGKAIDFLRSVSYES